MLVSGILLFVFLQISNGNVNYKKMPEPVNDNNIPPITRDKIKELESELIKNQMNSEILIQLGNAYFDIDNKSKAIVYYKDALNIEPANADVRIDMAICYHELGESERAIKEMEKSLEFVPNHKKALLNLGIIHHSLGNTALALHWWNKYLEVEPNGEFSDKIKEYMKSIVE